MMCEAVQCCYCIQFCIMSSHINKIIIVVPLSYVFGSIVLKPGAIFRVIIKDKFSGCIVCPYRRIQISLYLIEIPTWVKFE